MPLEHATSMRSPVGGGVLRLVPLAQLESGRDELLAVARDLRLTGALPMQVGEVAT